MYSNSLKYYPPTIAPLKKKEMILNFGLKESEVIFLDKDSITEKDREFYKNRIELIETINGKKAKIVLPKKGEIGIGGIHFENIENNNKLTIYGRNLNNEKSMKLIEVIKTVKFKKR
jgi:phage gp36-like protein